MRLADIHTKPATLPWQPSGHKTDRQRDETGYQQYQHLGNAWSFCEKSQKDVSNATSHGYETIPSRGCRPIFS